MSFEGRFWTENRTLVAVHVSDGGYHGHEIRTELPWSSNATFNWGDGGICRNIIGISGVSLALYNLHERVNPQSIEMSLEVVDCQECREYQSKSKGITPRDSYVVKAVGGKTIQVTRVIQYEGEEELVIKVLKERKVVIGEGQIIGGILIRELVDPFTNNGIRHYERMIEENAKT